MNNNSNARSLRTDTRIVYGAHCAWWDSIEKVGTRPFRTGAPGTMPCCPHCKNMLFEMPDQKTWWDGVDKHEQNGNPGYRAFIEWLRGKCFKGGFAEAKAVYDRLPKPGKDA
jgi:hypothetical protein